MHCWWEGRLAELSPSNSSCLVKLCLWIFKAEIQFVGTNMAHGQ